MIGKIKEVALPVAVLVAAGIYFGFVGAGPKTPEMLRPKAG